VLQVASFRTDAEAQGFLAVLRQRGHHAYVETAQIPGRGTWYRVRVGPYRYMSEAKKAAAEFEQKEHIVPFAIETEKEKHIIEAREADRRLKEYKRRASNP
jgi:cell division septation protein DedD